MTASLNIPVHWQRPGGESASVVSFGVPIPRGKSMNHEALAVFLDDLELPAQCRTLMSWPDGSSRWALVHVELPPGPPGAVILHVRKGGASSSDTEEAVSTASSPARTIVSCGGHKIAVPHRGGTLLMQGPGGTGSVLGERGFYPSVKDLDGREIEYKTDEIRVVEAGPVLVTVEITGSCRLEPWLAPLQVSTVVRIPRRIPEVTVEFTLHNTMAAEHPDNEWDLGDLGSVFFSDVSLNWDMPGTVSGVTWSVGDTASASTIEEPNWTLLQQSSGGPNWQSHVHVDWKSELPVRAPGYRIWSDRPNDELEVGDRARPVVRLETTSTALQFSCENFWQNFPKAARVEESQFSFGLFPQEFGSPFELQGGESKRHRLTIHLDGAESENLQGRTALERFGRVDTEYLASTDVLPYLSVHAGKEVSRYRDYVHSIVDGDSAFEELRERIDEFGWRHFGDTYADHEAAESSDSREFVSHYNNQYDLIHSAGIEFLRGGDRRWWVLMSEAAEHMIDIDLYKTQEDRFAYNNGLFWHTEHYRDAETSSHRTYSAANREGPDHGGGPSNEQNYTSGLLLYYCLSGDQRAKDAVVQMADWVIAMDDGSRSLLSPIDRQPTGLASSTRMPDFHKPGRGAGNSINALLDAFDLTGEDRYLDYAERLIVRCIHPRDDLASLGLDDPEERWSYLVFLQILGKYLFGKRARGEFDRTYYFARDSLLHYAGWMYDHEVPYKEVLDRVEYPTETWPAQDIRKVHVMHLAALYSRGDKRQSFADKAAFFADRCIDDVLSFSTAYFARPRILIAAYSYIHEYFLGQGYRIGLEDPALAAHDYDFGKPVEFVPQSRLAQLLTSDRIDSVLRNIGRRLCAKLSRLGRRLGLKSHVRTHYAR